MSDVTLRSVIADDIPALVSLVAELPEWFNKDVPEEVRLDSRGVQVWWRKWRGLSSASCSG